MLHEPTPSPFEQERLLIPGRIDHRPVIPESPKQSRRQRLPAVDSSTLLGPEKQPGFHEDPLSSQQEAFMAKIDQCCIMFDFSDAGADLEAKEIKRVTLCELLDYVANNYHVITVPIYPKVVDMFAKNIFRSIPPATYPQSDIFDFEDEPVLELAWSHMEVVYQLFLCVLRSPDFNATNAGAYIDTSFVHQLLQLFDGEDSRERDLLKMTLHCIYCKFFALRAFVRRSISNIFLQFIYETERFNGIAELLEIVGTIINGSARPLKGEHKTLLIGVLLPLHKPRLLSAYHPQLAYCTVQFVEKDVSLAETVSRERRLLATVF